MMVYDPPHYEGDIASTRCINCGHRIWEPAKIVMPDIPAPGDSAKKMTPEARKEENRLLNEASKLRKRKIRLLKQEARL